MEKGNRLQSFFPFLSWMKTYDRPAFQGDVTAGLTVAVMLIPQGMAYAMIAGLPPHMGLYAVVVPLFLYAFLGTSRQLAVGPVAMVSLLVATGVGSLVQKGSQHYIELAILLALIVGVMQLAMGLFRLGFLVNFLSHPVISGFTSAAAIIIGLSQIKHLLGANIPRSSHLHQIIYNVAMKLGQIHWLTLVIGVAGIAVLFSLKKWFPKVPGALVVVLSGTLIVYLLRLDQMGVKIVKDVPAGLPPFHLTEFSWARVKQLLPMATAISLVGFMESISVAKAFASRERYHVDANQELIALGVANIGGGFFSAYPVTGGFSRTAVNAQAGAKTTLASVFSAALVVLALLFLTPLFYFLPKAILAAIVLVAVFGLIDVKEFFHLWQVKRNDAYLLLLSFLVTLFVGIEEGILIGVLASLGLFIYRSTRPHTAMLGCLPGTQTYRNVERYEDAEPIPGIGILRFDASFYFANVSYFRDQIAQMMDEQENMHTLILDTSGINDMDSSADEAIHEMIRDLHEAGIRLYLAQPKGPVRDVLRASGVYTMLGEDFLPKTIHEAVVHAQAQEEAGVRPHTQSADTAGTEASKGQEKLPLNMPTSAA